VNGDGPTSGTRSLLPEGDPLDHAIAALPTAPPPPSIDHVWAAVEAAPSRRARLVVRAAVAAAVLVAVGAGLFALFGSGGDRNSESLPASIRIVDLDGIRVWRGDVELAPESEPLRWGDRAAATSSLGGRVVVGDRVGVHLAPGASITFVSEREVVQAAGRVQYDVVHDPRTPFVVRTKTLVVEDTGTSFSVEPTEPITRRGPATEHVLVCVAEGSVTVRRAGEAGGTAHPTTMTAGTGLEFVDGRPAGHAWPLAARPSLSLDLLQPSVSAGGAAAFRVSLTNGTDGWMPLEPRDPARNPLWIEVRDPAGAVTPIRVTDKEFWVEDGKGDGPGTEIPPHGRATVRVRLDHAFASPGTYRLRAVYRVPGAVESPASAEIEVTVK